MYNPERFFRNVVPDLLDNIPSKKGPSVAVEGIESPDQARPLTERIVPAELRDALASHVEHLPEGMSLARVVVGSVEDGTRHPHDYVIKKTAEDATYYFVDPEHQMGKSKKATNGPQIRKGDLRPKIGNLLALRLKHGSEVPELSILRFRAGAIQDPHVLKMSRQLEEAKKLLDTDALPSFLDGIENDVTFRLQVSLTGMRAESRYATPEELEQFLHGLTDNASLKGKLWSHEQIMRHFLKHLEAGRFKPVAEPVENVPYKEAA